MMDPFRCPNLCFIGLYLNGKMDVSVGKPYPQDHAKLLADIEQLSMQPIFHQQKPQSAVKLMGHMF